MKKKILTLALALMLLMALVIPVSAMAADVDQTVTGTTAAAYNVETSADFGTIAAGGTAEITNVITGGVGGNTVAVSVPDSSGSYVPGRLVSLDYQLSASSVLLITAPAAANAAYTYTPSAGPIAIAEGVSWDMVATAGAELGAWENVVITVTVN